MNNSLRRFFILILLGSVMLWWGVVTLWVYRETAHEVEEVYDANLAQTARALMGITEYAHMEEEEHHNFDLYAQGTGHPYESKLAFLISDHTGQVLMQSPTSPDFRKLDVTNKTPMFLPIPNEKHEYDTPFDDTQENKLRYAKFDFNPPTGFRNVTDGEHYWRVFSLWDAEHGILVETGERYEVRREMIWDILESVLKPLLYSLPLLGLLIWFGIERGLRPLQSLSNEISRRDPNQLDPLQLHTIPAEIRPLTDALNHLFIRLEQAFANERRFTADAAHELRTPLAGIKIQAEVARRSSDAAQQKAALSQIDRGVDRATHLVEQLLALARMDAQQDLPMQALDLHALAAQVIRDLWSLAQAKQIDLSLEGEVVTYRANSAALVILLRNLIDNALRYTPEYGQVTVEIQQHAIWVRDNGVGIAAGETEAMFERFRRGRHQTIKGSGLGLSIAKRIAELHGARLLLEKGLNGQGLGVCCLFSTPNKKRYGICQ